MALKTDLEKVYDKLEWRFIKGMLSRYNFPDNLIELIMSCTSSMSTSLLFNGSLKPFWPSRVIRQGDPLSPYIFILCMGFLGQFIQEKCETKVWCLVKASRSGPAFSHLLFADDLVLFAEANAKNVLLLGRFLIIFAISPIKQ